MKNLKKISRNQMKEIAGGGIFTGCVNECCPPPGKTKCSGIICPAVVCPQYA